MLRPIQKDPSLTLASLGLQAYLEVGGSVVRVGSLRPADLTHSSGAGAGWSRGSCHLAPTWLSRSHGDELPSHGPCGSTSF
jgi:hypothetical protein